MKNKELIALLLNMDQDMEVVTLNMEEDSVWEEDIVKIFEFKWVLILSNESKMKEHLKYPDYIMKTRDRKNDML